MKVTIDYFDRQRCNDVFEDEDKLDGKGINWDKMICAGSTNKTGDTCNVSLIIDKTNLDNLIHIFGGRRF